MPKPVSQFWQFKNSTESDGEATLYVYGDIMTYDMGGWNWPDDVVPNKFKTELEALGSVHTIHVRINSGGGSVFGAYAIMNLLKSHKAEIITHIDGIAASAATLIAMAGNKIISAIGSVWMVHLPSLYTWGNAKELQKSIEVLETITDTMVDVYHAKTGIDKAELRKMLDEDTWMSGTEALEKGFTDEVSELEVEAHLSANNATASFNGLDICLDKVRNKESLVAMLPTKPAARQYPPKSNISASINTHQPTEEVKVMTLAELQAKHPEVYNEVLDLGVSQGASSDAVAQARSEGHAEGVTAERTRIKEIDDMALPGMEALTSKAKYETGVTAAEYAMELIKAQKQKGVNFLADAKADAETAGDVPAAAAPQNDTAEEDALLAHAAEVAKTIKR